MKKSKKTEKRKDKKFGWFIGAGALCVCALLGFQIFFSDNSVTNGSFYENTKINGIDVGGMSVAEAENVILTDMLSSKNEIEIKLNCKDKSWTISGKEFEIQNNIDKEVEQIAKHEMEGNIFQKHQRAKQIKKSGRDFQISYASVLSNLDEKVDEVAKEIEVDQKPAKLIFDPDNEEVFSVFQGQASVTVKKDELMQKINSGLKFDKKIEIEVPILEGEQSVDIEKIKNSVGKRSEFSTSYEKSSKERKQNIKKALDCFNGMIVNSGQTVSFNEVTGPRTLEKGYKNAHIIVGGVYVDGVGGGVCQASTTLYNALLLADVDVLSVNHHTLPASYVPLSLDAMVSGEYSDLVFQNNFDSPIYIKTKCDEKNIKVEIFGQKLDENKKIKLRSELIKILPHNGDRIVSDTKGEYENKVLYKGEYYRLKFPKEGYESKAYVQYFDGDKLESEKEVRHDFYQSQDGVVVEGVEDVAEGMIVPSSDVRIIKPQKVSNENFERAKEKLTKTI